MSILDRKLIAVAAPVVAQVEDAEKRLIKGFVSVEAEDRQGHIVDPTEFDIKQFMANPAMLLNHKYFNDDSGNPVGVGKPVELYPAKLKKNEDNDAYWDVQDLNTKEIRNKFPKEKVPHLKSGDRGLFVVAQVTQPRVWDMVTKGEINAFSWRGLSKVRDIIEPKTNALRKSVSEIDLFEISLVNVPINRYSGFVIVGKGYDETLEDDVSPYALRFDRAFFQSKEQLKAYMEGHKVQCNRVAESEDSFLVDLQAPANRLVLQKAMSFPMAPGVTVLVAPLLEEYKPFNAQEIKKNELELVKSLLEEESVSDKTETKVEDTKDDTKKSEEAMEAFMKTISEKAASSAAAAVGEAFKPFMEQFSTSLTSLNETIKGLTKTETKTEPEEKEKKPEEISSEDIVKGFNGISQKFSDAFGQIKDLAESIKGLQKITPKETTREEKVEQTKGEEEKKKISDPNSVFDNSALWPHK